MHARLVRSAFAHALLVSRNVSAAKAIDGVIAVLLGEDVPNNEVWVNVPGQETEIAALKASMQVLATERVRYQGEPIALIIAETDDVFAAAEQAIEIEYAELPGVFDVQAALADDAPLVHDSGNLLAEWNISRGDVESAFAAADVVVDGEYYSQAVDHAYLEPEAGSAFLDDEGVITLTVATQVVEHFRDVAKILGVPHSKVRILAPYVGGGFGGKEDMTVEAYLALAVQPDRAAGENGLDASGISGGASQTPPDGHAVPHGGDGRWHGARARYRHHPPTRVPTRSSAPLSCFMPP